MYIRSRCLLTHDVVTKAYLKTGIYLVLIAFALGGAYVFEESFNASNMALTDGASFVNFFDGLFEFVASQSIVICKLVLKVVHIGFKILNIKLLISYNLQLLLIP